MKNKKRKNDLSVTDRNEKKPFNWMLLTVLVGNTVIFFAVYRLALQTKAFPWVLGLYLTLAAVLTVAYVVYNRGFSRRGVTAEMLPDTMSAQEKCEFIADGEQRMKKSKWMLTILFPLLVTFGFDIMELFVVDYLKAILGW